MSRTIFILTLTILSIAASHASASAGDEISFSLKNIDGGGIDTPADFRDKVLVIWLIDAG